MFLGLCREKDIDLAKEDERPRSKGAEIPGYKAVVYRSDKSARVGGLSFAIDSGRNVSDLDKVRKKVYHDPITPEERKRVDAHVKVVGLPESEYNECHGVVVETPPDLAERGRVCVRVGGDTLTLKRANVVLARPPQPPQSSRQPKKKKKKKTKYATASEAADFFSGKVRDAK